MAGFTALPANKVLVTIGTGHMISPLGRNETHRAAMIDNPNLLGFAAADRRFVTVDPANDASGNPVFRGLDGDPISIASITDRWGKELRENMGLRFLKPHQMREGLPTDIGGPLGQNLNEICEPGGLRDMYGFASSDFKGTALEDMRMLFEDHPTRGPGMQAAMFFAAGLMALSSLPTPLSELIAANRFRVAAGCCYPGNESWESLQRSDPKDKFANRLASSLNTHGPAQLNNALSPALSLSAVGRNPALLDVLLRDGSPYRNVPQAPLVVSAACASMFCAFSDATPSLLMEYPGFNNIDVLLLTAADACLAHDASILEGFGPKAMMTREKLGKSGRRVQDSLAPFDKDAGGTIVSNAAYGQVVTTLEFALKHFLPITSILPGWGQSGESGGKQHAAGVGYGGENAIIQSLMIMHESFGYSVENLAHLIAHATGTSANSKTDLNTAYGALQAFASYVGYRGKLPVLTVGAPKALAGHPNGPAGAYAMQEGIHYARGDMSVGIPTLREVSPELAEDIDGKFSLSASPVQGRGGLALAPVQGFAGYDAAMVIAPANPDDIRRHRASDSRLVDAYLERRDEILRASDVRERQWDRADRPVVKMALENRWPGAR